MTIKYFALEIGTARVCACYEQPVTDAYGCIVYVGDGIEIIKTIIEQPDSDFSMPPIYNMSYNPDHASFEQYQSAAVRHIHTHEYEDKEELIGQINAATDIAAVDVILGLANG